MFISTRLTLLSPDFGPVEDLYTKSFPENERGPLNLLLDDDSHCSEIYVFHDQKGSNRQFLGFASLLTYDDLSHILYLAIAEEARNQGYGAKALQAIKQIKPHHRLLADLECPLATAPNNPERIKRKHFYLSQGYTCSAITYDWQNELYEILVNGGELVEDEFWDFWEAVSKLNTNFAKF